jgi:hypothetical protein
MTAFRALNVIGVKYIVIQFSYIYLSNPLTAGMKPNTDKHFRKENNSNNNSKLKNGEVVPVLN